MSLGGAGSANGFRYFRLYASFFRYCLVRELAFRVNFLARVAVGVGWLGMLMFYFHLIFLRTDEIGGWSQAEYMCFMGTGFMLNAIVEALFVENCNQFGELVRTGNLDFALLKPIDEQFLLSLQRIDWATMPEILVGLALVVTGGRQSGVALTPGLVAGYLILMLASLAILYSALLALSASSVWIVKNQSIYELWWYVNQFGRYPAEIYTGNALALGIRFALTFIAPVLLAVNLPARFGVSKAIDPGLVAYFFVAAVAALALSRWFFRRALRAYRSASS